MTTETPKNYTFSIPEIQDVLKVDQDLDKAALQEKLKGFKQYPKFIYSLDDLNSIYEFNVETYERAKQYVDTRNAERVAKAKATPKDDFGQLGKLYADQAKLKVQIAKISQEQNLLDKQIGELEKKMNVR